MSSPLTAMVTNVQRFSLHDGPGIRTTVFFKGCSLRCVWCHNPETLRPVPELSVDGDLCLDCRRCATSCTTAAIATRAPLGIDAERCDGCGACAEACPPRAVRQIGRSVEPADLLTELLADRAFYDRSGGGVTLSGGEPVLQDEVIAVLAPALRAEGIHVLLQTAGHYPFRRLEPLLPHLDSVYFDWKLPDAEAFAALTGGRLALVEDTLRCSLAAHPDVTVRIPLLPGQNTGDQQVDAMADRLGRLGVQSITLLPYNGLWEAKLPRLQSTRQPMGWTHPVDVERVRRHYEAAGVSAVMAGERP